MSLERAEGGSQAPGLGICLVTSSEAMEERGLRVLTQLQVLVALPCCSRVCLARSWVQGTKDTEATQPQSQGPSNTASRKESYKLVFSQVTL